MLRYTPCLLLFLRKWASDHCSDSKGTVGNSRFSAYHWIQYSRKVTYSYSTFSSRKKQRRKSGFIERHKSILPSGRSVDKCLRVWSWKLAPGSVGSDFASAGHYSAAWRTRGCCCRWASIAVGQGCLIGSRCSTGPGRAGWPAGRCRTPICASCCDGGRYYCHCRYCCCCCCWRCSPAEFGWTCHSFPCNHTKHFDISPAYTTYLVPKPNAYRLGLLLNIRENIIVSKTG